MKTRLKCFSAQRISCNPKNLVAKCNNFYLIGINLRNNS